LCKLNSSFIEVKPTTIAKINWVLNLLVRNHSLDNCKNSNSQLTIGFQNTNVLISHQFYKDLAENIYNHEHHMKDGPWISLPSGEKDYLSSIFYLVNSLQEYGAVDLDHYGRFKYENSLQKKWGVVTKNIVWDYIKAFCNQHNISYSTKPIHNCFLTHDIDFLYAGWKMEGFWALRKGRILTTANIIFRRFFGQPIFANLKDISTREKRHGLQSSYFWISKKGRCTDGIKNADYSLREKLVEALRNETSSLGAEHGLHKSTLATYFKEEIVNCPYEVKANRYHFLKFNIPAAYDAIEEAGIKIDTSLGFAEHYGYRNSYGLPFCPYNMKEDRPYDFIEVPLHIMDGTFIHYMELAQSEVFEEVKKWIYEVKEHTLFTVLWHNNELTDYSYAEMSKCYDSILEYIKDEGINSVSQDELINNYLSNYMLRF